MTAATFQRSVQEQINDLNDLFDAAFPGRIHQRPREANEAIHQLIKLKDHQAPTCQNTTTNAPPTRSSANSNA